LQVLKTAGLVADFSSSTLFSTATKVL